MKSVCGGIYAVHALPRIALVRVLSEILALCDVQRLCGNDLVECVGCTGEDFACVAVARNIEVNTNTSIARLYTYPNPKTRTR